MVNNDKILAQITKLSGTTLDSGTHPKLLGHGLIVPAFKHDNRSEPENRRGITAGV